MAYVRLPAGMRVSLEYEVFGKVVVNVYHVTTTDPIVTIKLFDIADVFEAWWDTVQRVGLSPDIALTSITVLNLDVENGEKVTQPVSPPLAGQAVGDAVSNNVALVTSFGTAQTGRSFQGRSYAAGLREIDVTENNVTPAFTAGMVANYADLLTDLENENTRLVIASFQSAGIPRAVGVATFVDSISVNTRVDTQRRRLPS